MKKTGAKRKDIPSQIKGRHIKTNVQILTEGENIIMSFGNQPIHWFGMTKDNAIEIA